LNALVEEFVLDGRFWYNGVELTPNQEHVVRAVSVIVVGSFLAIFFQLFFFSIHYGSKLVWPNYKKLTKLNQVDWTSRWVALCYIVLNTYILSLIASYAVHDLDPVDPEVEGVWKLAEWRWDKSVPPSFYPLMFWHYSLLFAYELYDLKNCIDIKMYSGVIHHIVLLIIFPLCWHVSALCIPAVWMSSMTYWSNIPAHIRAFMFLLGLRDWKFYDFNKHMWWYFYAVFRLFFIPWWSAQMWFTRRAIWSQSYTFLIAYYFTAMAIHYTLSLYWFLGMTKSFYPQIPRVESLSTLNRNRLSSSSGSEDEGGQKFD